MTPLHKIRILLVDDHFIVRMGLAGSLNQEPDMEVIASGADCAEAVSLFLKHEPDITLMDGRLPDLHGTEAIAKIRTTHPNAKIILLSIDESEEDIGRATAVGVQGYLPKSIGRNELLAAIRNVAAGGTAFPAEIAERSSKRDHRSALTEREHQVLKLAAQGFANKQIADQLGIAEVTVKVRLSSVMEKLGVPDRTRAATRAIELGIIKM